MNFIKHSDLDGKHAFLGASKYHWINYSEDKIAERYLKMQATERGTKLHDFASKCIELRQRLPDNNETLNLYVNDAIDYKMTPEQVLYFSENCFGTADAISFDKGKLRIHDLKTGFIPAHFEQLYIYAALFCLEYEVNLYDISIELRIYQSNEILTNEPDRNYIFEIMKKIESFDAIIDKLKNGDI